MARSSGTYTAPSNSVNPAVEGTTIDEADFNSLVDDLEAALTESVYTSGLGSTDNRLVRTDGTDTKKIQGTGITVDDSDNVSGVAGLTATTINIGNADTTLARSGAGDITVEGNAIYRASGTDVAIADGGTGQSTKTAAFDALSPLTTQGDVLFFDGTNNVRLGTGTAGQVLTAGGAGANPSWTSVSGTGDVTAASAFGTDNRLIRSDGTGKGVQASGVTVDDSANVSGVATLSATTLSATTLSATTIELGHASDTTLARSGAGDVTVEGNQLYRAGGTDVPVSDGGTGVSALTAYAVICGGTTSTGAVQSIAGVGTAGQVLTSNGAGALPTFQAAGASSAINHGQCLLTKSGSNLQLSPFNGDKLLINGTVQAIPTAGVTLSASGLSAGTNYYIYAYMNSGTMTLEASTTTHAADTSTPGNLGVEIKSGDATRTLVGLARVITGPAWADSATQRFVISWFNRREIQGVNAISSNFTTTSTTYVEALPSNRVEFLSWASTLSKAAVVTYNFQSTTDYCLTKCSFDGSNDSYALATYGTNGYPCTVPHEAVLSEGYHYATALVKVGSTGTGTWQGNASFSQTNVHAITMG